MGVVGWTKRRGRRGRRGFGHFYKGLGAEGGLGPPHKAGRWRPGGGVGPILYIDVENPNQAEVVSNGAVGWTKR